MNKPKLVALSVLALLVVIVVLQNTQAVETKLLFFTITMPRAVLLFGAMLAGFAMGVLSVKKVLTTGGRAADRGPDASP